MSPQPDSSRRQQRYAISVSLAGRLIVAFGLAVVVWLFCAERLNHRCLAGNMWFEHYSPFAIAFLSAFSIVGVRRLWLGAAHGVALPLAFVFHFCPAYLAWIHGPSHPRFPAAKAQMALVLNDIRPIQAADVELKMLPQDAHADALMDD
jgi:hypothetical protein